MMGRELPFILNLANSIMGVSLLAMPFCFMRCGILLGTVLLLTSTLLTTITCGLLVKAGIASKRRSYEFLAYDLFGASGKFAVEVGITGVQLGICIAFHVIIGDLGPSLLSKWSGMENTAALRMIIMVISALTVSLPLSLMRNLESITKLSVLSICFYLIVVLSVFATSWPNLVHGSWTKSVDFWNTENIFQCLPIFAMAFGCQTQMFILYDALPEPSLSALNYITKNGVNLCMLVYLVTGFFGYIAFYDKEIGGDILLSFPPSFGADLLKFGFVLSVALSFPLMVFPCRQSLNTLLFSTNESLHKHAGFTGTAPMSSNKFNGLTALIIVGTLCIGINFPNVEFVIGLNGSTVGCLISFIFPAVMFLKVVGSRGEGSLQAKVVLLVGILTLCLSTYSTIQNAEIATEFHQNKQMDVTTGLATFIPINHIDVEPKKPPSADESKMSTKQSKDVEPEQQESPNKKEAQSEEGTRKEPPNPQPPNSNADEDKEDGRKEPPNPLPEKTDAVKINEKESKVKKKNKVDEEEKKGDEKESKAVKRENRDDGHNEEQVEDAIPKEEQTSTSKKKSKDKKKEIIKNEGGNKTEGLHSGEDNEETNKSIKKLIKKLDQQAELNKDLLEQNQVLIEGLKEIKKEKESLEGEANANKIPAVQQVDVQQSAGGQRLGQQPNQQPIGQQQNQQLMGQQQNQQPIGQQQNQQPIGQQQGQQQVGQQQNQQPIEQQQNQQPIGQQQGQQQIGQQQNQQPIGQQQNQQPMGQQQGQQPIGQQQNQQPIGEQQNQQPMGQQQGQQPIGQQQNQQPIGQQQNQQPIGQQPGQQPIGQQQNQQPIGQQKNQQPIGQQPGQQPIGQQQNQQPIGQQKNQQPIGQHPEKMQVDSVRGEQQVPAAQQLSAAQLQAVHQVLPEQQPAAQKQERSEQVQDSFIKEQENKLSEVEHKQKKAEKDAQELKKSLKQIIEKGENGDRRAKRDLSNEREAKVDVANEIVAMRINDSQIHNSNGENLKDANIAVETKNIEEPVRVNKDDEKSNTTNKPNAGNMKEEV